MHLTFRLLLALGLFTMPAFGQWTLHQLGTTATLTRALNTGSSTLIMTDTNQTWVSSGTGLVFQSFIQSQPIKPSVLLQGLGATIWAGTSASSPNWYKSVDSGRSWLSSASGPVSNGIQDFSTLLGTPYRFVCGSSATGNNTLAISRDGGQTFQSLGVPNWQGPMRRTCFLDSLTGFLADHDGALFKTTNQGVTWQMVNMLATGMIQEAAAIRFITDSIGLLFFKSGIYFRTTDRGNSWTMGVSRLSFPVEDAIWVNDTTILALSLRGPDQLSISTDQGISFTTDSTFSSNFRSHQLHLMPDKKVAILCDSGAYWLSSRFVSRTQERYFNKWAVFPNPGTNRVEVSGAPDDALVKLTVLDLTGRVVQSFQPTYNRNWNLEALASGAWILKFSAGLRDTCIQWIKQ